LLLFVPLVMAHQVADFVKLGEAVLGFLSFSMVASAGYIFNDWIDLESDRAHPLKKARPLASGAISVKMGMALIIGLVVVGVVQSVLILSLEFVSLLGLYAFLTVTYTLYFKRQLVLDVLVLASLYTLRIFAGGAATDVPVSPWLLAFSVFIFVSLAFVKRYSELLLYEARDERVVHGRAYRTDEMDVILNMGSTSGFLSVLVLALYFNSEAVEKLYGRVGILWLICPILLYWILRIWFLARRGQISGDPVAFALTDPVSLLVGFLSAAVVAVAATAARG
jgi:4-hydroxybenzoate polyprenyltransferase